TAGSFTTIDVPGASFTQAYGINDAGQIVGVFSSATGGGGFLDTAGSFTTINVPGAGGGTSANGINNLGQIVGSFVAPDGTTHGFLYSDGSFTTIDVPGGRSTEVNGINDAGQIVGNTEIVAPLDGFLGTPVSAVPEPSSLLFLAS